MLRVMICEDDEIDLARISSGVVRYFESAHREVRVSSFSLASEFMRGMERAGPPDIALLDIFLPDGDGLSLARTVREKYGRGELIFITVSKEFAVSAFELHAAHYLLKPTDYAGIAEALDRAVRELGRKKPRYLSLKLPGGGLQAIDVSAIIFIESVGSDRVVRTAGGEYAARQTTLTALLKELDEASPGQFLQAYRGYIVNLEMVRAIEPGTIILHGGAKIPIKSGDFRRLRDLWFDWAFRRKGGTECDGAF